EELVVLGVGARPPALDVVDAQPVELLGDAQLVVDREGDALELAPVAKGGVEHLDALREPTARSRSGRRSRSLLLLDGGGRLLALAADDDDVPTRHVRPSPCTGRPRPGRPRSRSPGWRA